MNTLFIYIVKVAVYLIALYLVYSILLSRDTSYSRNRVFILISLASALIFPFLTLHTIKPLDIQFFGKLLNEVFITATPTGAESLYTGPTTGPLQIMSIIYFAGIIVFILKLIIDLLNLLFLIARRKSKGSRIIRFHGFNTAGFSAMGYIFLNTRLNPEEAEEIIKHEQNHLNRNHFIDIIFVEIIKAFQWFNPVIHLFNRSLRAIHEYQADQGCLSSGIPMANYQTLLLSQVFKSRSFNLSNSFSNPSLIKKRMIMMTKKRTSTFANIKLLLVVPVISMLFLVTSSFRDTIYPSEGSTNIIAASQTSSSDTEVDLMSSSLPTSTPVIKPTSASTSTYTSTSIYTPPLPSPPPEVIEEAVEEPFIIVEEMPQFPGGEAALLTYISDHIIYPEIAKENNIQGRVTVSFCVTSQGGVDLVTILRGVDPELDAEAMRVVRELPLFKPGKQGGKPVAVWYRVPITFKLN